MDGKNPDWAALGSRSEERERANQDNQNTTTLNFPNGNLKSTTTTCSIDVQVLLCDHQELTRLAVEGGATILDTNIGWKEDQKTIKCVQNTAQRRQAQSWSVHDGKCYVDNIKAQRNDDDDDQRCNNSY